MGTEFLARGSGHLCALNRSNSGQVDIGFLHSECCVAKYLVIMESRVTSAGSEPEDSDFIIDDSGLLESVTELRPLVVPLAKGELAVEEVLEGSVPTVTDEEGVWVCDRELRELPGVGVAAEGLFLLRRIGVGVALVPWSLLKGVSTVDGVDEGVEG